ncbi:glycosyltransferase [Desulfoscipio geothermicus]|uniref:Glycosyltransferase involved in cell wall bisynthesis n=1 Tax=Desulfoscipio geothermicus DSM 3669 TaxID=1121426 RepID=A0A1I6E306_9FIRM|nr:glycosyltransferase [Desulfoscipio geothermicus]SFR12093.1 Glycosyltransferase involved in cell wall bisynthesis [Desulfoscipio geothermicus DSM 3669]
MQHNIWIINHYAVPPQLPGGTRHYEFAAQLVARGYAVTIWLSLFHHGMRQYVDKTLRNQIKNDLPGNLTFNWVWSLSHTGNDLRRALNMLTFFMLVLLRGLFAPAPQVVIASSPHLLAGLAGWVLSKVKRSRFILEIRDVWPDSLVVVGIKESSLNYKIFYRLAHFLYRKSQRIIVLTEGIRDTLVQQGVDEKKIVFIPNGVSLNYLQQTESIEETRHKLGFGNKFVCLYAGAHGPANALDTVLDAAGLVGNNKEILIALMGDGPDKPKLQARAREMNLKNLIFLDPVPKSAVLQVLQAADALILSLKKDKMFEGSRPNKFFDYLAAGRPVICAVEGEVRKLVEEVGVGIFARPEDGENLAAAINQIYINRHEMTARASSNGPSYIKKHASREKMTDILEKAITQDCDGVDESPAVFIMTVHRWDDPRIYYKQAHSLARKYRVELHAPGTGKPFEREGVRVVPLPQYGNRYFRPLNWVRLFYRGWRTRAKIIHLHDPELLPLGFIIKILFKKKIIYDVHENFAATMEYKTWVPACMRPVSATILGGAEKWFARRVDALVLAVPFLKELFAGCAMPKTVVCNYPLLNQIPGPREHKRTNIYKIIYAGGISKPRGAVQMVRALSRVNWQGKDFRLYLVGPCQPHSFRKELIDLAVGLGMADKMVFTGLLPLEEVYKHYSDADLGLSLLHPEKNYINSLATKIFDYMAAGLPVVASNFPHWIELVEGNKCGVNVNPVDEIAIARNIEILIHDINRRNTMGINGYRAFILKYNWRTEERKLLSLYDNLLLPGGGNKNE